MSRYTPCYTTGMRLKGVKSHTEAISFVTGIIPFDDVKMA